MAVLLLWSAFVTFLKGRFKGFFTSGSTQYLQEETIDEHLVSDYNIPGNRRKPNLEQDINLQ